MTYWQELLIKVAIAIPFALILGLAFHRLLRRWKLIGIGGFLMVVILGGVLSVILAGAMKISLPATWGNVRETIGEAVRLGVSLGACFGGLGTLAMNQEAKGRE